MLYGFEVPEGKKPWVDKPKGPKKPWSPRAEGASGARDRPWTGKPKPIGECRARASCS
jgi:ATP-dependent RNA helicase DeaD